MLDMLTRNILMSTPLILASVGMIVANKSGHFMIGMEAVMLISASVSYQVAVHFGTIIGLFSSIPLGIVIGIVLGILWIKLGLNQVVTAIALIIFGYGFSSYLSSTFGVEKIVATLPPIYLLLFTLTATVIIYIVFERTIYGLRVSSIGFVPHAADTAGIDIFRAKYIFVILSCIMGTLAGCYFPLMLTGCFSVMMTGGIGYVAIAVSAISGWNPLVAVIFSIGFTIVGGVQYTLRLYGVLIPPQFLMTFPYILAIGAIVIAKILGIGKSPTGIGVYYNREKR